MLTPDYIRNACDRLRRIAQDLEDDVLAIITAALMVADDAASIVSETTVAAQIVQLTEWYRVLGVREIRRVLFDAIETSTAAEAQVYREAAQTAADAMETPQAAEQPTTAETPQEMPQEPPQEPFDDPYVRNVSNHYYQTTAGTWYNLTETEAYAGTREYVNAADAAARATAAGESWSKARRDALDELTRQGIEIVTSETSGRGEHIDTALERNTRTAVARLAGDIALNEAIKRGFSLVLVSAHYGARPEHTVWQGKIYSINGDTSKYPDFWKETGYGTMLGLCGINCRHSFSAFAEGMRNPYEGTDYSDPQRYKDEQTQRAMERNLRALHRKKRELDEIYKAEPSEELKQERRQLAAEIREARAEYEAFCAAHDFRPLWERTRD